METGTGKKDSIRKDSATAQFPIIRALLSAAAVLGLELATIDISGVFLQAGPLKRKVYVRLPYGWTNDPQKVWKLLVPPYGLVESGRLWQLAVEDWMEECFGVEQVPGMPQLFLIRGVRGDVELIIAKIVDDFLLAVNNSAIHKFHDEISKRFKVGRFIFGENLVFNRLHIHQDLNRSVFLSMEEYMATIMPIGITRDRRKMQNEKCTEQENKTLLELSGKLNWLGHGITSSRLLLQHYATVDGRPSGEALVRCQ